MPIILTLIPYLKTYWKIFAIIGGLLFIFLLGRDIGITSERRKWEAIAAEARIKANETNTNNKMLNAALKGSYYEWSKNLDIERDTAINGLSGTPSSDMCGSGATSPRIADTTTGNGICAERIAIAKERIRLAAEAKRNARKLLELQKWSVEKQ